MGSSEQLSAFIEAGRRAERCGLIVCSSGNLSWRVGDDEAYITASRSWMGELAPSQVAVCRISDGAHLGGGKPSVEAGFHLGILRKRTDVDVVLHCQSPWATVVACLDPIPTSFDVIPEVPYYIGQVGVVPYRTPGTPDLAEPVIEAMRDHDLVLLQNHGQVVVGKGLNETIQKGAFFELACRIVLHASDRLSTIPAEGAELLRQLY